MFIKKHIEEMLLQKKNMGLLFWIPIAAVLIFIPSICLLSLIAGDTDDFSNILSTCHQIIVSFLSVWWVIFSCSEYLEGDGAELLSLYRNNIICTILRWTTLYMAVVLVPFPLYLCIDNRLIFELPRICLLIFLLNGIAVLAMAICKSTGVSLVCVIAYMTVSVFYQGEYFDTFLFFSKRVVSLDDLLVECRHLLPVALVCWAIGALLLRRPSPHVTRKSR